MKTIPCGMQEMSVLYGLYIVLTITPLKGLKHLEEPITASDVEQRVFKYCIARNFHWSKILQRCLQTFPHFVVWNANLSSHTPTKYCNASSLTRANLAPVTVNIYNEVRAKLLHTTRANDRVFLSCRGNGQRLSRLQGHLDGSWREEPT